MAIITISLIIIFLLFLNGFYVAAEFSAVITRQMKIKKLANEGNSLAKILLSVIIDSRNLDDYVSTCQMGITVASLILGAYGQAKLAIHLVPLFQAWGGLQAVAAHSASAAIVLIFLSIIQMLFGEFIPKTLAIHYSETISLYTVIFVKWFQFVFYWFIKVLNCSSNLVLRILRMPIVRHRHIHSPEEIEYLISESFEGGLLKPDEHKRLHNAFGFSKKLVVHLMVPRTQMSVININTPLIEAIKELSSKSLFQITSLF